VTPPRRRRGRPSRRRRVDRQPDLVPEATTPRDRWVARCQALRESHLWFVGGGPGGSRARSCTTAARAFRVDSTAVPAGRPELPPPRPLLPHPHGALAGMRSRGVSRARRLAYFGEKDRAFRSKRTTRFGRNGPGRRMATPRLFNCQKSYPLGVARVKSFFPIPPPGLWEVWATPWGCPRPVVRRGGSREAGRRQAMDVVAICPGCPRAGTFHNPSWCPETVRSVSDVIPERSDDSQMGVMAPARW
jgi:hypothetical protein